MFNISKTGSLQIRSTDGRIVLLNFAVILLFDLTSKQMVYNKRDSFIFTLSNVILFEVIKKVE
jgi:hypothetical protein